MRNKQVLWGHHVDEYRDMFDLSTDDLSRRLLEYGCGPSAINAQRHEAHATVVSCDPLFDLNQAALSTTVFGIFDAVITHKKNDKTPVDYSRYGSLDGLIAYRREGLAEFFADYEQGRVEKRYLPVRGNHLPFAEFEFDLALSSHYLFADSREQGVDFHVQVLRELTRVAKEVRVFPLDDQGKLSPLLGPVLLGLQHENYGVEVRQVNYPLQNSGQAMLRVWAQQCHVGSI